MRVATVHPPTAAAQSLQGLHLDLFGDQQSLLYMAPEAIAGMAHDAPKLDVFALGAVAYHICSGQPPATSIEALHQKCYQGRGLRISEVMDGAGQALQELIQFSTAASVEDRLDSVRDFLALLEGVETEVTAPLLTRWSIRSMPVPTIVSPAASSSRNAWARARPVWPS